MLPTHQEQGDRTTGAGSRRFRAIALILPLIGCSAGGLEPDRTAVESVSVVPATATISVGASFTLQAEARDADGTMLTGRRAYWAAEDPNIALVSESGRVTARKVGVVQVAASIEGKSGFADVTVTTTPVSAIRVTPDNATLLVGDSAQFTAVTRDAGGSVLQGRPVAWTSSNSSVASVSNSGLVTAIGPGATIITGESEGKSALASVNVSAVPVAALSVSPATKAIVVGQSAQFSAVAMDAGGDTLTGRVVVWSTSDPTVATVTSTGSVTAVAAGSASIRATSEGKSGSASVSAVAAGPASVVVSPSTATLDLGENIRLSVVVRDHAGAIIASPTVTWSTSDSRIATVNSSGRVTGRFPGTATITATSGSAKGTATITVKLGG